MFSKETRRRACPRLRGSLVGVAIMACFSSQPPKHSAAATEKRNQFCTLINYLNLIKQPQVSLSCFVILLRYFPSTLPNLSRWTSLKLI